MSNLNLKKLRQAQQVVNSDPDFRSLGNIDIKLGLKVDGSAFLITFSGFTCHQVEKINSTRFREADCLIEMKGEQWNELSNDLNSSEGLGLLGVDAWEGMVTGINPRKKMDLYRYLTSVEAFLRVCGRVEEAA
tara:strand:+ start:819 stop:1217 length:399 start_codon:yes stop_codon:yes gene_type:complete